MKNIPTLYVIILLFALNSSAQTSTPVTLNSGDGKVSTSPQVSASPTGATQTVITKSTEKNSRSAYVPKDAPVRIPHFETAPVIDGQLNDEVWQRAAVFGDFLQTKPGDNIAQTHPTEFMMGY